MTVASSGVVELLSGLTEIERRVAFGALVAQHHDIHAVVYNFDAAEVEASERLAARYESPVGLAQQVLFAVLAVSVHELDHPSMSDAEIEMCEQMLTELSKEFGAVFAD